MKLLCFKHFAALFVLILSICTITFAQPAEGNVVVINNSELAFHQQGSIVEFDSLTAEYNKYCRDNNQYIISYKVVRHWWGNNNRDFVTIVEVKNWDDVLKFNEREDELFMEHWNTKEKRKAFNDAYNKYFTGKHSDEIYREIKFGK